MEGSGSLPTQRSRRMSSVENRHTGNFLTSSRPGSPGHQVGGLTYEGVEGRVGADPAHLVDGLEGQDVLLVLGAAQRAAGTAAGAQVPGREGHGAARCRHRGTSVPGAQTPFGAS